MIPREYDMKDAHESPDVQTSEVVYLHTYLFTKRVAGLLVLFMQDNRSGPWFELCIDKSCQRFHFVTDGCSWLSIAFQR